MRTLGKNVNWNNMLRNFITPGVWSGRKNISIDIELESPYCVIMIEFNTYAFERSHRKMPRGYGSWGFFFDASMRLEDVWFAPSSTYAEAKKLAKAEAKRRFGEKASGTIYVAP